jgi:HTH-type transcriptional regulator/antitoxin HipB
MESIEQQVRIARQLGAALKRAREIKRLTQKQLAERTGLRQATISGVEEGRGGIRFSTIETLLNALELELVVRPRASDLVKQIEDVF